MRPFLHNLFRFTGFTILGLVIFIVSAGLYYHRKHIPFNHIPPPMITNSDGYNDKLLFARNKQADIVAIGSSMSLNNINSDEITHYFKSDSYLNLSSWGMTPKDVFYLMETYASIHKPKAFIINGSLEDLEQEDKKVDYAALKKYLTTTQTVSYYIKNSNLIYYAKNFPSYNRSKAFRNIYESLVYDKYGGVPIDSTGLVRSTAKWEYAPKNAGDRRQYDYLDSLSTYCKRQNLSLIYFESPVREGLAVNKEVESAFLLHNSKVEKILTKNGQVFVRSNTQSWPDNFYIDGLHMNEAGAALYTRYCLEQLGAN